MFVIIGYLVVVGSIVGGYALAGGHVGALLQPLELLMIGGGALGAFIVSNPTKVLKATFVAMPARSRARSTPRPATCS
jgi:chemotaxis protein MotA